jgi:hypothetical protein
MWRLRNRVLTKKIGIVKRVNYNCYICPNVFCPRFFWASKPKITTL